MTTTRRTAGLNQDERDLLIEIKTKLEGVTNDVKELKDSTAARLTLVEKNKAETSDVQRLVADGEKVHEDHEKRIRETEKTVTKIVTWGSAGVLALGIAEFLLSKLF